MDLFGKLMIHGANIFFPKYYLRKAICSVNEKSGKCAICGTSKIIPYKARVYFKIILTETVLVLITIKKSE